MSKMNGILFGAAIGTLLGSLAVALYPKRNELLKNLQEQTNLLSGKALEAARYIQSRQNPFVRQEESKTNFWFGSLIGLISGASAALLLTPTTGKLLRKQIINAYSEVADRTHDIIHVVHNNHARTPKQLKEQIQRHVKKKPTAHVTRKH